MNGEQFWDSREFRKFLLCFTFLLVVGPMLTGILYIL